MGSEFRDLPPVKRFKLLQEKKKMKEAELGPFCLPPKKRIDLPRFCLPAKKRIELHFFCLPMKKRVELRRLRRPPERRPREDRREGNLNGPISTLPAKKRVMAPNPFLPFLENPFHDCTLIKRARTEADKTEEEEYPQKQEEQREDEKPAMAGREEKEEQEREKPAITEREEEEEQEHQEQEKPSMAEREDEQEQEREKAAMAEREDEEEQEREKPAMAEREEEEEEEEEDDGVFCGVCQSPDGDPQDPIVFCDGCDLMVHASCYGNPLIRGIPEGEWFCRGCESRAGRGKAECCLCPAKGGALKETTDGRWAHVACALLVPEAFFRDPVGREETDLSLVPARRWKGDCCVCGSARRGCVVDCSEDRCGLSFHASCGLGAGFCVEYRQGRTGGGIVVAFCQEHTRLWTKQQATGKFKFVPQHEKKKKMKIKNRSFFLSTENYKKRNSM